MRLIAPLANTLQFLLVGNKNTRLAHCYTNTLRSGFQMIPLLIPLLELSCVIQHRHMLY